jgi:uncharacterized membrane protein
MCTQLFKLKNKIERGPNAILDNANAWMLLSYTHTKQHSQQSLSICACKTPCLVCWFHPSSIHLAT